MDKEIYSPSVNVEGNMQPPVDPNDPPSSASKLSAHIIDFIQSLVLFGAIFAIIYLFVAQPHKVSGLSMYPTFDHGDYILTDKVSYRFGTPRYGDVIVLKNPKNESQDFIKRIIGIPGDILKVEKGQVFVNNQTMNENFLSADTHTRGGTFLQEGTPVTVPEGQYLVFGDNRNNSSDSRTWGFITKEEIVGKVFFRYWPPNEFGPT